VKRKCWRYFGNKETGQCVADSIFFIFNFYRGLNVLLQMINEILDEIGSKKDIKDQYQVIKFNGYLQETDELALQHLVRSLNNDLVSENEFRGSAAGNLQNYESIYCAIIQ
jgi:hypothetical protein